jgi:hypothetical protein
MENAIPSVNIKIPYFANTKNSSDVGARNQTCNPLRSRLEQSMPLQNGMFSDRLHCNGHGPPSGENCPTSESRGPSNPDTLCPVPTNEQEGASHELVSRNGKVIHVLKRDGRLEPLSAYKVIRNPFESRLARLACWSLG